MPKFVKKPIEIEAYQIAEVTGQGVLFHGDIAPHSWLDVALGGPREEVGSIWTGDIPGKAFAVPPTSSDPLGQGVEGFGLWVGTLEGWMTATAGDWILRGIKSEIYPCEADIFAATYDEVHELQNYRQPGDKSDNEALYRATAAARASGGQVSIPPGNGYMEGFDPAETKALDDAFQKGAGDNAHLAADPETWGKGKTIHDDACDAGRQLVEIARTFIDKHQVSCAEATAEDGVYAEVPELVEQLADVVGYYKYPEDEA